MEKENIPIIEKGIPIPSSNKFQNGKNNYKWKCIELMTNMDIGDSIKIKNRSLAQVKYTWLWRASSQLGLKDAFKIESIDKSNHRVWRVK